MKQLADQYTLSEQQHDQKVNFITSVFDILDIILFKIICTWYLLPWLCTQSTVEAKGFGASDCWFENEAIWGKIGSGTVSDESICWTSVSATGNWEKFALAAHCRWGKIPTVSGEFGLRYQ